MQKVTTPDAAVLPASIYASVEQFLHPTRPSGHRLKTHLSCCNKLLMSNTPQPPHHNHFTALFPGPPGEPAPGENFWTLWCNGRLTEADTMTIRLGATPSELTSAYLHHPPYFFYRPDALPAAQPTASKHWRQCLWVTQWLINYHPAKLLQHDYIYIHTTTAFHFCLLAKLSVISPC